MKSGVYIIKNLIDDRVYIGSAKNIEARKKRHLTDLTNNKHHSIYLQRFTNKYGIGSIFFDILEYCDSNNLLICEQKYLELYIPEFNICKIAGSCIGISKSEEFKKKISILTKGVNNPTYGKERTLQWRKNISNANKGQVAWNKGKKGIYSEDTINKMRIHAEKRKFSKETRKKISDKAKIPIYQYDKLMNFIKEWDSTKEASKKLYIPSSNICIVLKGINKTAGKFIWRYKNEPIKKG